MYISQILISVLISITDHFYDCQKNQTNPIVVFPALFLP